jgi:hypothetical protein
MVGGRERKKRGDYGRREKCKREKEENLLLL